MKTKSIFIAAVLFFASSLCLRAQEVYEYGVVTYSTYGAGGYEITTSIGENFTESKGKVNKGLALQNFEVVNTTIDKLAGEGWEVYSTTANGTIYHFYLRRKK